MSEYVANFISAGCICLFAAAGIFDLIMIIKTAIESKDYKREEQKNDPKQH